MVGFRVLARIYTGRRFWWDDWCHIVAGVCCDKTSLIIYNEAYDLLQALTVPLAIFTNLCAFTVSNNNND